jgi:hypothetical protein
MRIAGMKEFPVSGPFGIRRVSLVFSIYPVTGPLRRRPVGGGGRYRNWGYGDHNPHLPVQKDSVWRDKSFKARRRSERFAPPRGCPGYNNVEVPVKKMQQIFVHRFLWHSMHLTVRSGCPYVSRPVLRKDRINKKRISPG